MALHKDTQGPAPDGFHVPTKDEWGALCGILTTTLGLSSNGNTMKTYLKMPFAGYRNYSSSNVNSQGSSGYYWSSSRYDANNAYRLYFPPTALRPQDSEYRAHGYPVRCFKDSPTLPDSNWTTLYDGGSVATGAGVFHNATLGLISVSGDGTTWYTIQDKNLGATTVYNDGDTLSEANCGGYFQWGNNYMFPRTGTIANQSTTQVDASAYGPGDYYSSDTFIKYNGRWDTTDNGNLRGGETNGTRGHLDIRQHGAIQTFHWKRPYEWKPGENTIAYYPLNGNANDESGNGNNGTASNITWDSGGDGGCAYFNGNSYISIPALTNTTKRTYSFWVKFASNNSGDILFTGDNSDKNLTFMASSGKINTQIWKSGIGSPTRGITNNYSNATVGDNTWHYIVVTVNESTYTTYIDGVLDNVCNWSYGTTPISVNRMGMHPNGSSDKYTGYIDNMIIESKARTAEEIQAYYNQTKSTYGL